MSHVVEDYTTYSNQLGKCKELSHVIEDIDSGYYKGEDTQGKCKELSQIMSVV